MNTLRYYGGLILNLVVPVAALMLLVLAVPKVIVWLMPFVLAYLLALIANPLVEFLNRHLSLKRQHSSLFITIFVLFVVVLLLYFLGTRIFVLLRDLLSGVPQMYNEFVSSIRSYFTGHEEVLERLSPELLDAFRSFTDNLNQTITSLLSRLASPTVSLAGSAVKSVPTMFINALIFVLSAFCFLSEWDKIQGFLRRHMPKELSDYVEYLKGDLKKIFGTWLLAQFKIMFVVFAVLYIGLRILGIRYAFWLSLLTAFLDFLPAFGVGFIFWPWIALTLLRADFMLALWLSVIYICTQVVRQVLQPKIMGDTMGLPPLWTLFFLYVGFKTCGLAGMIFSVPVGMLFLSLYRYGIFNGMIRSAGLLCQELARLMQESMEKQ